MDGIDYNTIYKALRGKSETRVYGTSKRQLNNRSWQLRLKASQSENSADEIKLKEALWVEIVTNGRNFRILPATVKFIFLEFS